MSVIVRREALAVLESCVLSGYIWREARLHDFKMHSIQIPNCEWRAPVNAIAMCRNKPWTDFYTAAVIVLIEAIDY